MNAFTRATEHLRLALSPLRHLGNVRWLVLGIAIGVCTGLAASGYYIAIEYFSSLFQTQWAGLSLPTPSGEREFHAVAGALRPWIIPLLTTATGLLTGILVQRFIPDTVEAGTDGTDATIKAFHHGEGVIRSKVFLIRGLASVFTIASGGSAGREGPITQIGAGLGSLLARTIRLSVRERRLLLLAGAAGGLGAIFRAPLGGALTAVEVIYREDFEAEAILPSVLSSVTSYSIFTLFFGTKPIFGIPQFVFRDPRELLFYAVLALVCAAAGWLHVRIFSFCKHSAFSRLRERVGIMWTMTLGGLATGLAGMIFPPVLSGGYGWLEQAMLGQIPFFLMLAMALSKSLATGVTLGSGMSGGMFAPAMFVGGMSGGLVGLGANALRPDIAAQPGGYVLVGMAAFFAGIAKAPVGPMVMVCEFTQGYGLLVPLMLASALCIALCRRVSLYENQADNKFDSPAHASDVTVNVLERSQVAEYAKLGLVTVLEQGTSLRALTDIFAHTTELYFPVRDGQGRISGILSIHDVRNVLFERELLDLVVVGELAGPAATLRLDDDLYTALTRFVETGYGQLPVVSPDDPEAIIGRIDREDVFRAYAQAIRRVCGEGDAAAPCQSATRT